MTTPTDDAIIAICKNTRANSYEPWVDTLAFGRAMYAAGRAAALEDAAKACDEAAATRTPTYCGYCGQRTTCHAANCDREKPCVTRQK